MNATKDSGDSLPARHSKSRSPTRKRSRSRSRDRKRDTERYDEMSRSRKREDGDRKSGGGDRDRDRPRDRDREDRDRSDRRDRDRDRDRDRYLDRSDRRDTRRDRDRPDRGPDDRDSDRKDGGSRRDTDRDRDGDGAAKEDDSSSKKRKLSTSQGDTAETERDAKKPKRSEPEDLEAIIKQKAEQAEQELTNTASTIAPIPTPKFLTKAERKELAKKKREEEIRLKKEQEELERQQRQAFFSAPSGDPSRDDRDGRDRDRERARERDRERERERERERDRAARERRDRENPKKSKDEEVEEKAHDKEIEEIKKQKMGIKEKKRRFIKPSEKFKFVFEWDASEDTSRDINPLYSNKLEARPMFGRGYIGGIDKREQLRKYTDVLQNATRVREVDREKAKYQDEIKKIDKAEASGRHWSEKKIEEMQPRDWRIFKEDFNISTKGGGIPLPIRSWEESTLPEWLLKAVKDAGYERPTPIQMQAIPIGLQGRDILGVAETGSGKTAAFVLPMLMHIDKLPKMTRENEGDGPYAVVMAPARELAQQIEAETRKFAKYSNYRTVLLVGGQPIEEQAMKLRKGCEIIIATPGRLNDCIENHYVVLNQCNYIVLDEADRMIDMGFEQQVVNVLEAMPKESLKPEDDAMAIDEPAKDDAKTHHNKYRTTLMFSATMPPEVERLSRQYLRRPGVIYIGVVGRAVDRIKQNVISVKSDHDKKNQLERLLREGPPPPIIIFVNQRKTADSLAKYLAKLGWQATSLQGGRTQDQRDWALSEFRERRSDILVATDVAGRGLDVKGVTHVINYDMPKNIEQYTHRIGRTGRAGESGQATSFLHADDTEIMYDLKKMLQDTENAVPHELSSNPDAQIKPGNYTSQARRETVIYTHS